MLAGADGYAEPQPAPPPPPQEQSAPPSQDQAPPQPASPPRHEPVATARPGFEERILPDEIAAAEPEPRAPEPQPEPVASPEPEPEPAPPAVAVAEAAIGEIEDTAGTASGFDADPVEPPQSLAQVPTTDIEEPVEEFEYEYSQFEFEPPFRARRNLLKLWTVAASVFALFAIGTVVAVSYWGLPDWVPVEQPEFGPQQPDLSFDFPPAMQDRRQLSSGTEYFVANGTVTNNGRETRRVPTLLVKLRDERDRVVFESEIVPPKRSLTPGETLVLQAGMPDIPRSARVAEFGWKPG